MHGAEGTRLVPFWKSWLYSTIKKTCRSLRSGCKISTLTLSLRSRSSIFYGRPNLTEELHSLYWNDPNLMPTNQRYLAAIHSADYLIANDSFRWFIATYPKDGPFLAQAYEAIGCPRCAQAIEDAMKKAWPAHGKQELNGYERLELEGEDFLRKEAALYSEESGKIDQRRRLFLLDNWQDFVSKEGNGNTKPID